MLYSLAKSYQGKNSEGTYAIKDKGNNLLTQRTDISVRWGEYFNELLNVGNGLERSDECVLASEGMPVEQEDLITIDKVRNAIKETKKGKSPGDDGIPKETVKAGGECVLR